MPFEVAAALIVFAFVAGMIVGCWSAARAYEEGMNPDTGYEPTGDSTPIGHSTSARRTPERPPAQTRMVPLAGKHPPPS
jgi:hypothetical protein